MFKKIIVLLLILGGVCQKLEAFDKTPTLDKAQEIKTTQPSKINVKASFTGFSDLESWGRWTDAHLSTTPFILIELPEYFTEKDFKNHFLVIDIPMVYLPKEDSSVHSKIFINQEHVLDVEFNQTNQPKPIEIPLWLLKEQNQSSFKIQFKIIGSSSPKDFGSSDQRLLGLGINSLFLKKKPTIFERGHTCDSFEELFDHSSPLTKKELEEILEKNKIEKFSITLMTPRSGSTWFCGILKNLGVFGTPSEYFNEDWKHWTQFDEFKKVENTSFYFYLDTLLKRTSQNKVFSLKTEFYRFEKIIDRLISLDALKSDKIQYSVLLRRDIYSQALSWYQAEKTGVWHNKSHKTNKTADISKTEINENILFLQEEEIKISQWIKENKLKAFSFKYEDLTTNPCLLTASFLSFHNIPVETKQLEGALSNSFKKIERENLQEKSLNFLQENSDIRDLLYKRWAE